MNSKSEEASGARMISPTGWVEPGQRPDFQEMTVVLKGLLQAEFEEEVFQIHAGQAIITRPKEWVRYSSPGPEGAEYIAICLSAFSPEAVQRDKDQR